MRMRIASLCSISLTATQSALAGCFLGCSPEGLSFDAAGNLWVAYYDTGSVVNLGIPSAYLLPAEPVTIQTGLGGPTRLSLACGLLHVANSSANTVDAFNAQTSNTHPLSVISGLQRPLGVAIDASGNTFVAENASSDIAVYNSSGVKLGTKSIDASGHLFTAPGTLTINGAFLYVGTNDGSVHAYSTSTFINSLGGCTPILRNQWGCWGPYAPPETATYSDGVSTGPTGIAFDPQGNVYVSYYYSSDVVEYSPNGAKLMPISSGVSQPEGIAVSSTGYIYVANTNDNGLISVYTPQGGYLGDLVVFPGR